MPSNRTTFLLAEISESFRMAMGAVAAALAVALTVALFRTIGPRRTRLIAQIVAAEGQVVDQVARARQVLGRHRAQRMAGLLLGIVQ